MTLAKLRFVMFPFGAVLRGVLNMEDLGQEGTTLVGQR
jgi:hypothetical protein